MSDDSSKKPFWRRLKGKQKSLNKPPKNFGGPVKVIATTVLIFIVSQLVAALLVGITVGIAHPGTEVHVLDGSTPLEFVYVLIAEAIAVSMVWLALRGRGLGLASIGLGRAPAWKDIKKGLLGFGAFYVVLIIVVMVITALIPALNTDQKQDVGFQALNTSLDQVLAFVALVILPPLGEEVLVRGYLYSGLRSRLKFLPALLATSLIFGAAHLQFGDGAPLLWAAALDTFLLSVVLVYLREKTGALYAGMLIHMLNNLIAFGVHFK
ncbi:CPBP family intramembrane metalloprotease [Candidatus Saccharibacteria bacterium]|nr:CPBP family intramembrane metalloprotease [Candidatus Saccharibacteria bacterium]